MINLKTLPRMVEILYHYNFRTVHNDSRIQLLVSPSWMKSLQSNYEYLFSVWEKLVQFMMIFFLYNMGYVVKIENFSIILIFWRTSSRMLFHFQRRCNKYTTMTTTGYFCFDLRERYPSVPISLAWTMTWNRRDSKYLVSLWGVNSNGFY